MSTEVEPLRRSSARAGGLGRTRASLPAALALLLGCASLPPPSPPSSVAPWPPADTTTGIHDPTLRALVERYWTGLLEGDPENATRLSIHRFDDRWRDYRKEAFAARSARAAALLAELEALQAGAALDPGDRMTAAVLRFDLAPEAAQVCRFEEWNVSAMSNPFLEWSNVPDLHLLSDPADAANLMARYRQIAPTIDAQIGNLRRGKEAGRISSQGSVSRAITVMKAGLAEPLERWALLRPLAATIPGLSAEAQAQFRQELKEIVEQEARPAFLRFVALLEQEILPAARSEDAPGLASLGELGAACYAQRIRAHLGEGFDPETLHREGLEEIAKLDQSIVALGRKVLGQPSLELPAVLAALRGDPALYFRTEAEVEEKAKASLAAAKSKLGAAFGRLPKADCVVRRVPSYEAPYTTIAYYRPPSPGEKPGEYFINVEQPERRPRFEAAVLAYHESIPGHHLQVALAQELEELPAFRKHSEQTAYVEGWALYVERVADELGLYEGDLDRLGMLSFDAWRASRLVVDTGLHARGWSRQQAIDFMAAHTALSLRNIENEVDRYIGWPGQALAYKVGQRRLLALRAEAEQKLGPRFSLPAFHDAVLEQGPLPLEVLTARVRSALELSP